MMDRNVLSVTCVLASFNRPKLVRQALRSVSEQTHPDYELIVMDDSSIFDVRPVVAEFFFPKARVFHTDVTPERRASENRLGVNLNRALEIARGDLVCYLCDDDYFYPTWFERAATFMGQDASRTACYGRLLFSSSMGMEFPAAGPGIWPGVPVADPFAVLDHNQVVHRRFDPPFRWPETVDVLGIPDGTYFRALGHAGHVFHPVDALAAVKRRHAKCLHNTHEEIRAGLAENARE